MHNFVYLATVEIDYDKPDGVAKKILNQFGVFRREFNSTLIHYGTEGVNIVGEIINDIVPYKMKHRKYQIFEIALEVCKKVECEYLYIRYPRSEPAFLGFLQKLQALDCKVIVEIPTYPYNLEKPQANYMKEVVLRLLDKYYRQKLKKYIYRIVTYSADAEIWGIKTINTMNGIVYDNNRIRKCNRHEGVSLVSCARYYDCHGCERIIKGLRDYYKRGGKENIVFHIVGEGMTIPLYKKLTIDYGLQEHVVFHGFCTGKELEEIYDGADMGVNSLAIHRLGLISESTLKTKEYAAKGLPIISSYKVDAFSAQDNEKFVCLVPADDSPIDIERIVEFYYKLYTNSAEEVASEIRQVSLLRCDMQVTLQPIIDAFIEK